MYQQCKCLHQLYCRKDGDYACLAHMTDAQNKNVNYLGSSAGKTHLLEGSQVIILTDKKVSVHRFPTDNKKLFVVCIVCVVIECSLKTANIRIY